MSVYHELKLEHTSIRPCISVQFAATNRLCEFQNITPLYLFSWSRYVVSATKLH